MMKWQSQKLLSRFSESLSSTFYDIFCVLQTVCKLAYPALNSDCHSLPKLAHGILWGTLGFGKWYLLSLCQVTRNTVKLKAPASPI